MIASLLRLAAIACSAILIASFAFFVADQARSGEKQQVAKIAGSDTTQSAGNVNQANPPSSVERVREKRHGSVREAIDDGNDVLTSPFSGIVSDTGSIWAQRGVSTLLALLVFGVGLRFLASFVATGRWK